MSRDMKNNRRASPSQKGNPLLLGVIIGALIGISIAIGVALFLNRSPSPFNTQHIASAPAEIIASIVTNQDNKPEILHPDGSTASSPVETAASPTPTASAVNASNMPQNIDYAFYKVLAGHEDKNKPIASSPTPTSEKISPSEATPTPSKKNYLQLGAFQSEQQADNLKAKLALVGVTAHIQSKDNGGLILHRVRVGPFISQDELIRMRNQLKQNGIESSVVNH